MITIITLQSKSVSWYVLDISSELGYSTYV